MDGRQLLAKFLKDRQTQAEFARAAQCSEPHLTLILQGKRSPSLGLRERFHRVSGGSVPDDERAWLRNKNGAAR